MSDLVKRLNDTLGGVEVPQMKGDNLAVTLCSHFDDHGPEVDDYGWSQAAVDGYNATLDAIRAHYAPAADEITRLTAALATARDEAWETAAKWHDQEGDDYRTSLEAEEADSLVRGIYADSMNFHRESAKALRTLKDQVAT